MADEVIHAHVTAELPFHPARNRIDDGQALRDTCDDLRRIHGFRRIDENERGRLFPCSPPLYRVPPPLA
jgi:hypothetical protein